MKLARCPYCGKKVEYSKAFFMHNEGEHFCDKCKKESNVIIKKDIFIPFIIAVIVALLIVLAFFMLTDKTNLLFVFLVAVPFIVFYILTPFFVVLKPKKKHMDSLYDTSMVESPIVTPDRTVVTASKVKPTFVDDVILDDEYKPSIDKDVFESIKKDRSIIANTDGGTKPVSSFEEISSKKKDETMPVKNLKDVQVKKLKEKPTSQTNEILDNIDKVLNEEENKNEEEVKVFNKKEVKSEKIKEEKNIEKVETEKIIEEEKEEIVEDTNIDEITADDLDPDFDSSKKSYDLSLFE